MDSCCWATQVTVNNPSPVMTLNEYIRTIANLKGTKKSCLEGGCGACVVSLTQFDSVQQKNVTFSVNSVSMFFCFACHDFDVDNCVLAVPASALQRGWRLGDDD